MVEYQSKHGIVRKDPYTLYMSFVDMRNFVQMLPEDKREMVKADYDSILISAQGYEVGAKVFSRTPYSRIELVDYGAPFAFKITLSFDANGRLGETDFSIKVEADLNFMMKMMLGSKIQEGLDKIVDGLVAVSEGRIPEGVDPEMLKHFKA
ncbi:MAG: hypothetical protein J6Y32_03515 [Bacteroidales bacterium]|nr:hypothetical protein [Bacteroidales bacterium]